MTTEFRLSVFADNTLEEEQTFGSYDEAKAEFDAYLAGDLVGDFRQIEEQVEVPGERAFVRTIGAPNGERHSIVLVSRAKG